MQDIATELGISKMSVSKCFKNSEDISEETKQMILKKSEEMGYEYKKKVKYRVAVLFSEVYFTPNEKFYSGLYKRLQELEWANNIQLSLFYVSREAERTCTLNPGIEGNDGIMFLGQFSRKYVLFIKKMGIPMVCLDFYYRGVEVDSVVSDNFQASYNLTSYLMELGHREITFVGNLNYTNSVNDRYLGYYKAILEGKISEEGGSHIDDRDENGILKEFPLPEQMPTAFVCNNDHTALLLIQQLKKKGYQVPEQISVVGFDDVLYSKISEPPITSVHVQRKCMAEQAVSMMKCRWSKPEIEARTVTVGCTICYRKSVAPVNQKTEKKLGNG